MSRLGAAIRDEQVLGRVSTWFLLNCRLTHTLVLTIAPPSLVPTKIVDYPTVLTFVRDQVQAQPKFQGVSLENCALETDTEESVEKMIVTFFDLQ